MAGRRRNADAAAHGGRAARTIPAVERAIVEHVRNRLRSRFPVNDPFG